VADPDALRLLAKGRAIALKKQPYFSTLIYSLIPFETLECDTAFATPGLVLGYNPYWIKEFTEEEIAGLYLHEANHVVRVTWYRIPDGDPELRAIAADIPINDDIKATGLSLPSGGVFAATYGLPTGKTMEEYYALLTQLEEKKKGSVKGKATICAGACGGISGNPGKNAQLEKELDRQVGRAQVEVKAKQLAAIDEIKKYISSSSGRGTLSSDLQEYLDLLTQPAKVYWPAVLKHTLSRSINKITIGGSDYSMSRPSSRAFAREDDIIRPGIIAYEPEIILCRDTSGSMGEEQHIATFDEIAGVIRATGCQRIWFLDADASVKIKPKMVSISELKQMPITGHGGTDFRPAITYVQKMKPKPNPLIYFTDGDGFAPMEKPKGLDIIWCVVPSHYNKAPAPWGKTIFIED
jgi:predicted metal-dependent peptidase